VVLGALYWLRQRWLSQAPFASCSSSMMRQEGGSQAPVIYRHETQWHHTEERHQERPRKEGASAEEPWY
jgi:hypothetical protein